jgi:tellurite resistance protein
MRVYVGVHGSAATIDAACQVIPRELRPAAFALSADLVLADGRIEPAEQRFLAALADRLGLTAAVRNRLREAMLVKNGA